MTASNGLKNNFQESAAALGTDVFYVSRMPWIIMGDFNQYRNRENLSFEQGEQLIKRLPRAKAVIPSTTEQLNIKYRSKIMEAVPVIGTTEQQIKVIDAFPEWGRFITPQDVQFKKFVCVIGAGIKEELFRNTDPLHKDLKIGRYNYRIIGIMEKRGSAGFFGGPNFDRQIFIPVTTLMKAYGGHHRGFQIAVKSPGQSEMADFRYKIVGEMRKIRKLKPTETDNFSINSMDTLMQAYNTIMGVIILIGFVITSISLFVGAVGVMNIMFVAVTERTREIGIRKAIGATRKAILSQFLFESAFICLIGGIIGLAISFGIAELIDAMLMPAALSIPIALIGILVATVVGIASGFFPALRAARLNPIDALHYE